MDTIDYMPPQKTRSLRIIFSSEITQRELELFRGAVIRATGGDQFFHNHTDGGYVYSYPLIQYKRIGGKAAVVAIDEAVDSIGKLLMSEGSTMRLGDREIPYCVEKVVPSNMIIRTWDTKFSYHLHKWLPLNEKNYEEYQQMEALTDRIQLLERVLTGNILSMCKGLSITISDKIECSITEVSKPIKVYYKRTPMVSMDVEFACNVSIPDYFGLGKGASIGRGICTRKRTSMRHEKERSNTK